jgi:undecaprenyl-diphosphatase
LAAVSAAEAERFSAPPNGAADRLAVSARATSLGGVRAAPLALAAAAGFAVVAGLDGAGTLAGIDAWSADQLMPGLDAARSSQPTLVEAVTPFGGRGGAWERAVEVWLYPASAPLSALVVALCALVLRRRGRSRAAVTWCAAWVVGVAVEVLVKHVVERPPLIADGHHLVGFDGSLPSGHTLRALIVAAAVASVWRRPGAAALAWALTVLPLLVVLGWHTPSDVLAGALLALAVVATAVVQLDPARNGLRLQSDRMLLPSLDDPLSTDAEPAPHQASARPRPERRRPARAPRRR